MKKFKYYIIPIFISLVVFACNDDDDDTNPDPTSQTTLTFDFQAKVGDQDLVINEVYDDYLGRKHIYELFKFYVSNLSLIDLTDEPVLVKDVALIDFNEGNATVQVEVVPGSYKGISMGIGLDPSTNASDPNTFPDTHPLASARLTYWSWADMYKFIMLEGKVDSDSDDSLDVIFNYHTGLDTNYRVVNFDKDLSIVNGQKSKLNFVIDMNDIFTKSDTLNYIFQSSWHGNPATADVSIRLSDNFAAGLKLAN